MKLPNSQNWLIIAFTILGFHNLAWAIETPASNMAGNIDLTQLQEKATIESFCQAFAKKLRSVDFKECLALELLPSQTYQSTQKRPLTYREITPNENTPPKGKILFVGGIHGDEYSAISLGYLWLKSLLQHPDENRFHWLFLPLTNPDGLFASPAQRQNASGVDLNRNFPSPDWNSSAFTYWKKYTGSNPRRYPGPFAESEPETQWIVNFIKRYKPDVILSLHAPFGLLDYDGPDYGTPDQIGHLKLRQLGTYPGSLGRYAGEFLNIPVLTIELEHAGRLPSDKENFQMWQDFEAWVDEKLQVKEEDF
ncbi:MAG: succinylglutamate desuccinylase/aspartoacylase family protein [Thiotrichales bacterium]|nr:succinylglutamate desuccinylase/aspartoacylase family protein [Thiotrichales bacterium]